MIDGNSNASGRRTTSSTVPNCQIPEVTADHFRAAFRRPTRPRAVIQRAQLTEIEPDPNPVNTATG